MDNTQLWNGTLKQLKNLKGIWNFSKIIERRISSSFILKSLCLNIYSGLRNEHKIEFKDHKTKCIIFWFLEKLKIY